MRGTLRGTVLAAAVIAAVAAAPARAFDNYTFTVALQGGFAGSLDVSGEQPFDQSAFQFSAGMVTQDRTMTMLRVGKFEFDDDHLFAGRFGAEIEYATIAGEYRFRQPAYDFGLFVGVGGYRLSGDSLFPGTADDETVIGFVLGGTGDFDLTRHFSIVAEVDFHYALFDDANLYGSALAGVAVHF